MQRIVMEEAAKAGVICDYSERLIQPSFMGTRANEEAQAKEV
jgi:hypothetical protein